MQEILDTVKHPSIQMIGIPEGKETHKGIDNLFHEIVQENIPNLKRHPKIPFQEIQSTPKRINPSRSSPRHIIVRLTKTTDKDKILRLARKKMASYLQRLRADFSMETM